MFRTSHLPLIFLLLLSMSSCIPSNTFSEFKDIPSKGWNRYDTLFFSVPITTSQDYSMQLNTRNRANYPYQNLWLFISCKQDSVTLFSDTVQVMLSDKMGNWNGSGWGSLYELSIPFKSKIHLNASKKPYYIKVVQGMRDYDLQGVESIGIQFDKY
ncbi:MAG: gliding motility lipoprotein GldH [Bacteroidales bacterium]|nr:gliding motility lipoprotein GldH [Bacteroidales bacterium]